MKHKKYLCVYILALTLFFIFPAPAYSEDNILRKWASSLLKAAGTVIKLNIGATSEVARVFGDVNRDGILDWDDFDCLKKHQGIKVGDKAYEPNEDLNRNGGVTSEDISICRESILKANDIDMNGKINMDDFYVLKLYNGVIRGDVSYNEKADLNHDGIINQTDRMVLYNIVRKWFIDSAYRCAEWPRTADEKRIDLASSVLSRQGATIPFNAEMNLPEIKVARDQ